jgi:TatD DNase family protein
LVYTLGIHPLYTNQAQEADINLLEQEISQSLSDPRFVGIGEIGLDYFVEGLDPHKQEYFLNAQLDLAQKFQLPVILHVRRSQDTLLKYLRRISVIGGLAHAFNGSDQQAHAFIDLGFVLGFGGAMTFTRALQIRRLASSLPGTALALETDAPDISPAWLHPASNNPQQLPRIAAVLAELRGQTMADIERQTTENVARVLPRLGSLMMA